MGVCVGACGARASEISRVNYRVFLRLGRVSVAAAVAAVAVAAAVAAVAVATAVAAVAAAAARGRRSQPRDRLDATDYVSSDGVYAHLGNDFGRMPVSCVFLWSFCRSRRFGQKGIFKKRRVYFRKNTTKTSLIAFIRFTIGLRNGFDSSWVLILFRCSMSALGKYTVGLYRVTMIYVYR